MNLNIDSALEAYSAVAPVKNSAKIIELESFSDRRDSCEDEMTMSEKSNSEINGWARWAFHANGFGG